MPNHTSLAGVSTGGEFEEWVESPLFKIDLTKNSARLRIVATDDNYEATF